jgi:antitoxin FitA
MAVSLSIKNVPDKVAVALRERARRNRRSLQGELLAIIEQATTERTRSARDVLAALRAAGIATPREAARMIRKDRDGR